MSEEFFIERIHHGYDDDEKNMICQLLKVNGCGPDDIKNRLRLARPVRDDWILGQFVAGLIPYEDRNLVKWRFLRENPPSEVRDVLREYVLDEETDEKLAKIVKQIEDLKKH